MLHVSVKLYHFGLLLHLASTMVLTCLDFQRLLHLEVLEKRVASVMVQPCSGVNMVQLSFDVLEIWLCTLVGVCVFAFSYNYFEPCNW